MSGPGRAVSQQSRRHLHRRHGAMGIDGPRGGLFVLGLGLRQRRLARHLRHVLRPHRSTTSSTASWASRTRRYSNRLFHNIEGQGASRTRPAKPAWTWSSPPWGATSAISTTTASSTCTWAPAIPTWRTLVPNRMFKNVGGRRFAEITGSSRHGHLQKGHAVACGDWDRDGDVDIFIEMGGAVNGDKYHNILFQNPGQGNHWLTVKLVGQKTNRAAIGARIKVVTAGETAADRSTGTSRRAAASAPTRCEQTIGLGKADRVALLEIALADQRHDPGLPRHRRRSGDRESPSSRNRIGG